MTDEELQKRQAERARITKRLAKLLGKQVRDDIARAGNIHMCWSCDRIREIQVHDADEIEIRLCVPIGLAEKIINIAK